MTIEKRRSYFSSPLGSMSAGSFFYPSPLQSPDTGAPIHPLGIKVPITGPPFSLASRKHAVPNGTGHVNMFGPGGYSEIFVFIHAQQIENSNGTFPVACHPARFSTPFHSKARTRVHPLLLCGSRCPARDHRLLEMAMVDVHTCPVTWVACLPTRFSTPVPQKDASATQGLVSALFWE